jgi:hypothetical protein
MVSPATDSFLCDPLKEAGAHESILKETKPLTATRRTVVKKKPEAALKAVGVYLAINALIFGGAYIVRWLFSSSIGHWLEIDKPTKPYLPGSLIVLQIFPVMIAYYYYRDKVKRG